MSARIFSHDRENLLFFAKQDKHNIYRVISVLEFSVRRQKIAFSFTFFAVIAAVTLWDNSWGLRIITALICCILHELGHITAMCLCSAPPERITFYAGGIKITPCSGKMISPCMSVAVLSAGCMVNILLAGAVWLLCGRLSYFGCANLFLGLFNLLPLKYFDGGRILSELVADERICECIRAVFILMISVVLICMLISGSVSISLLVTFIYIAVSEIFS